MPTPAPEQIVAQAEPVAVTLDLRKYGVTRSDSPAEDLPPLVLPRANVNLTLLLPVGSEPGEYEIRILDGDERVVASSMGTASILDYVARLRVVLDSSRLRAVPHQLHIRRHGEQWQHFGVSIV